MLPTRSSTASKLSHRIFMSLTVLLQLIQETWDVGNAFLRGLTFEQLDRLYKSKGLDVPK